MAAAGAVRRWQLRREDESIWIQYQLGQRHECGSRGLHEPDPSHLDSGGNQHTHRRLVLFQRFAVDELSSPFLPPPLAVKRDGRMIAVFNQKVLPPRPARRDGHLLLTTAGSAPRR